MNKQGPNHVQNSNRNNNKRDRREPAHMTLPQPARPHVVSPTLVREPTVIESFSRNLKTFWSGSTSAFGYSNSPPSEASPPSSLSPSPVYGVGAGGRSQQQRSSPNAQTHVSQSPPQSRAEPIISASFDVLNGSKVLVLVYLSGGVQVWDLTSLSAVRELLNLSAEMLLGNGAGRAKRAKVVPGVKGSADAFSDRRPLLAILSSSHLIVFSLSSYSIIKQIPLNMEQDQHNNDHDCDCDAQDIVIRPSFSVVSTANPPALHIFSTRSFERLHTIPIFLQSSNIPWTPPIFTLSERLLAYASPVAPPPADATAAHLTPGPHTFISRASFASNSAAAGKGHFRRRTGSKASNHAVPSTATTMATAMASTAATTAAAGVVGVGKGLASMMKLGGEVWKKHSRRSWAGTVTGIAEGTGTEGASGGDFAPGTDGTRLAEPDADGVNERNLDQAPPTYGFSRSAPVAGTVVGQEQPAHHHNDEPPLSPTPTPPPPPVAVPMGWVTVLDLAPLLSDASSSSSSSCPPPQPRLLTSFTPFPSSSPSFSIPSSISLPMKSAGAASRSPVTSHVNAQGAHYTTPARTTSRTHAIAHLAFGTPGSTPLLYVSSVEGTRVGVWVIRAETYLQRRRGGKPSQSTGEDEEGAEQCQRRDPLMPSSETSHDDKVLDPLGKGIALPWHLYDLHRGLTAARIEHVSVDNMGRWVGVTTGRKTIHIFATNPYGGKPARGHLDGWRMRNATKLQPLSTSLHPIIRIRPMTTSTTEHNPTMATPSPSLSSHKASIQVPPNIEASCEPSQCPSSFPPPSPHESLSLPITTDKTTATSPPPPVISTFLPASVTHHSLPHSLLPSSHGGAPTSSPPSSFSPRFIHSFEDPSHMNEPALSVQDVLVFDPANGELALRRIYLDWRPHPNAGVGARHGAIASGSHSYGGYSGYSTSLPVPIRGFSGMTGIGGSRSSSRRSSHGEVSAGGGRDRDVSFLRTPGYEDAEEEEGELVARESAVAVWGLRRGVDWSEVKEKFNGIRGGKKDVGQSVAGAPKKDVDFLSQAELTTYSRLPTILPHPIYLSHQFSFHTFAVDGGDYHSLLLRGNLDIPSQKLDVRKDVVAMNPSSELGSGATPSVPSSSSLTSSRPRASRMSSSTGDAFIHGAIDLQESASPTAETTSSSPRPFSSGGHTRGLSSSSFDASLSTAMHTSLEYTDQSPPVLPMFPNGPTTSNAGNAIIEGLRSGTKHVGVVKQGVGEGLRVLGREIERRRRKSAVERTRQKVGLHFEGGDDTVFLDDPPEQELGVNVPAPLGDAYSGGSGASVSISTPESGLMPSHSPSMNAKHTEGDQDSLWEAWDDETRATIAEAETFDEISVAGFLDEEQEEERKRLEALGVKRPSNLRVPRVGAQNQPLVRMPEGLVEAELAPEMVNRTTMAEEVLRSGQFNVADVVPNVDGHGYAGIGKKNGWRTGNATSR